MKKFYTIGTSWIVDMDKMVVYDATQVSNYTIKLVIVDNLIMHLDSYGRHWVWPNIDHEDFMRVYASYIFERDILK